MVASRQCNGAYGTSVYGGGKSPVWCTDKGSTDTDSNVTLVDKVSGQVDVSHANDDDN